MITGTGDKVGKLTLQSEVAPKMWLCLCDCGNTKEAHINVLRARGVQSCGCLVREKNTTHGMTGTRTYKIWTGMLARCYNKNNTSYQHYGARGVTVCKRWHRFENFFADMGVCPEGLTLERVKNSKGYSKQNCVWATRKAQLNNRRNNIVVSCYGETKTVAQWAQDSRCIVSEGTFRQRLGYGWGVARALETKSRRK